MLYSGKLCMRLAGLINFVGEILSAIYRTHVRIVYLCCIYIFFFCIDCEKYDWWLVFITSIYILYIFCSDWIDFTDTICDFIISNETIQYEGDCFILISKFPCCWTVHPILHCTVYYCTIYSAAYFLYCHTILCCILALLSYYTLLPTCSTVVLYFTAYIFFL